MSTNQPTGKSVLLFSGGMDSLAIARLLAPDILLYVKHGSAWEGAELASVHRLAMRGFVPRERLVVESLHGLGKFARPDAIIPMRNLFFLALAAQFGERLYLGAMDGDRSLDKSSGFFRLAEGLFEYLHREQHWCEARTFEVLAPFAAETKTSLVRQYLAAGHPAEALLESLSCYAPANGRPCGTCKPCFRKWVALANNGVGTESYFARDPRSADWLSAAWPAVESGTYRGREDADWVAAMAVARA